MEHAINTIRRELGHCRVSWEYAKYEGDAKGMRFILGYHAGLERALAILDGADALVDEEVEVWWDEREAKRRAGTLHVTPWEISVWLGGSTRLPFHLFTLHRRMTRYVNQLTTVVAFLSRHGVEISLQEERD